MPEYIQEAVTFVSGLTMFTSVRFSNKLISVILFVGRGNVAPKAQNNSTSLELQNAVAQFRNGSRLARKATESDW